MGHARALLALPTEANQLQAAREVKTRGLSVRDTEALVKSALEGREIGAPTPRQAKASTPADVHTRAAEDKLKIQLGTRVRIIRKSRGGRIEIDFTSEDELIRIYDALMGAVGPSLHSDNHENLDGHSVTDRARDLRGLREQACCRRTGGCPERSADADGSRRIDRLSDLGRCRCLPVGERPGARADGRFLYADRRRSVHLRPDRRRQRAQRRLRDGRRTDDGARDCRLPPGRARPRHDSRNISRRPRQAEGSGRGAARWPHRSRSGSEVRLRNHGSDRSRSHLGQRRRTHWRSSRSSPSVWAPASSAPRSRTARAAGAGRSSRRVDDDAEQDQREGPTRVRGSRARVYRCDRLQPDWSLERDGCRKWRDGRSRRRSPAALRRRAGDRGAEQVGRHEHEPRAFCARTSSRRHSGRTDHGVLRFADVRRTAGIRRWRSSGCDRHRAPGCWRGRDDHREHRPCRTVRSSTGYRAIYKRCSCVRVSASS